MVGNNYSLLTQRLVLVYSEDVCPKYSNIAALRKVYKTGEGGRFSKVEKTYTITSVKSNVDMIKFPLYLLVVEYGISSSAISDYYCLECVDLMFKELHYVITTISFSDGYCLTLLRSPIGIGVATLSQVAINSKVGVKVVENAEP